MKLKKLLGWFLLLLPFFAVIVVGTYFVGWPFLVLFSALALGWFCMAFGSALVSK